VDVALDPLAEDWDRALAVVAHPDDLEYGAASAVARWTSGGRWVGYVLATSGEAGIRHLPPEECGPLRETEQRESAAVVGVDLVELLGFADGLLAEGPELRRALAAAIRRHHPDVVVSINFRDSWGGPSWNHADHRALGRSLLDAVRDADNPWLHPEDGEAWGGVRFVAFSGSPSPTHAVDVTEHLDAGVASLRCHRTYLDGLGDPDFDADRFLRGAAEAAGARLGVPLAVAFEVRTP
jgi:LmbE family N-acetylglucosaminyl deacetylase